jgi:hypothetical protein
MKSSKTTFLTVRLAPSEHSAFHRKAKSFGGTSFVLREIVSAFIDSRLIIQPNPERPTLYTDPKTVNPKSFLNNI